MQTNFKRPFALCVKKNHKPLRLAIEDEVGVVCETPEIGELYVEMKRMPTTERLRFFPLLTHHAFREDDFTHEQVFGETQQEPFSAVEAAEYLEVSLPTLRRYVQSGKLVPSHFVGRNQLFSSQTLRTFKRNRRGQV